MQLFKKKLTKDEISIIVGILLCAGIVGMGIYLLLLAPNSTEMASFIWFMITGAMLFNAGISGITALAAIYFNYQAIV